MHNEQNNLAYSSFRSAPVQNPFRWTQFKKEQQLKTDKMNYVIYDL